MTLNDELTIIIPAKNEETNIPRLMESILKQDYDKIRQTKVILGDANSTDKTREIFLAYGDRIPVEVTPGGLPSISRNAGAKLAKTRYLLFCDADIQLVEPDIIRLGLEKMKAKNLHCLTAKLYCQDGNWKDHCLYCLTNFIIRCSKYISPFSVGAFMFFEREKFEQLGGFNEKIHFSEDYYLSKQVAGKHFGVISRHFATDNRRFQKLGYWKMIKMFTNTVLHSKDDSYFFRDHHYFD
jgi:glycosyltransferase involved in cell wall biosynthesis